MYRTITPREEQPGELKVDKKVCIHPLYWTKAVDLPIIHNLKENLNRLFSQVVSLKSQKIPWSAFKRYRGQFNSTIILETIEPIGDINLGVLEEDIYSNGFNFVFGEAELGGSRAVISIHRLRPEFYGHEKDMELLKLRTLKEAVHEMGHVMGLKHCPDEYCVMHFSNSIKDTDIKNWRYCKRCQSLL